MIVQGLTSNVDIGSKQSFTAMLTVGHMPDFSQDKWECLFVFCTIKVARNSE